jgi:hypothetical protein
MSEFLLKSMLPLAVFMAQHRVAGMSERELAKRRTVCSQYLAEHGDALMYRQDDKTADAFNRTAEAIAILSFSPGGVDAFGMHFEWKGAADGAATST